MKLKKTFFSIFMRIAIIGIFLVSLCAILFSLSLNHVVALSYTVSTEAQLQEALESSVYDEIILSNSITLSNGTTIDGDLDGNGIKKTIRAEVTGTTSQGVVNEDASNYTLFYVSRNATVTIKNCNIKGGGITAIVNGEASNSTNNNSTLYIDNCSISNSGSTTSPGGGIRNTVASKVVLTNSSISRNIANFGAGFQNQQGTFIVDNCSISENRSFQFGGGGGENTGNDNKGGADAYMYIVNSTIANNTSQEIGGGINNCKNGYLYVINSVIAGNATTNPQYSGGGIGNNNSTLKCTNSILMDNVYLSATGGTTEQDVYEYSSGQLSLDGCVYGSVTGSDQNLVNEVEVDSTCYQATSSDNVFASSKTGSIIDEDGHQGTNTYNQVVLVEDENGVTYAPLSSDSLANMANNPSFSTVKVEFDYSDLNNIVLKTKDECSNETEAPTVCGTGKQLKSNEHILTLTLFVNEDFDITGGTVYGDSYIVSENGNDTVTLKATPVKGKENKSVLWAQANVANETLTYLSSDNAYEINLSDSNLLNSCWDETKNSYNLIIQPITLNLSSEASDKSVRLSYSTDYSDTFCKNYSLTNNITSYDIYYSVVNDFESSSKQFFGNVTSTSTTITDLTNETTYYFYVVARIGNASFSGTIVGYTEETPIESGTKTYILVDALESGKEYLIVGRNTAGTGYALTNNNTNRATATAVTVTTLDSTPIINAEVTDSMLWTVTGSGTSYRISNGNRNIYLSSNTNITSTTSRNLTVTPTSIKYNNYSLQLTSATPSRYYGTRNVYFYEVKHKQDVPTTIEGSIQQRIGEDSGLITGVTNKMEYSTDGLSWNSISSTTLENMPVGKYFFRYKETNLAYASAAVTVEILEKKLEQINIHTNPKLAYTAKDNLDLSGLVVTLIYNDGTSTDVTYNDFASLDSSIYQRKNGIVQTSISNGTILECSDNDSRITISLDGLETVTAKLSVSHHLVHVERKEATCTENGNEEYYICDSCGIMYSDSEGLNRIYVIPTIYATSHVWGSQVIENRVEPTCIEAGHYDLVMYCERCHEELQRQTVELSPLGHTWGPQVIENQVEPTCDTNGHYDLVIYCSVCGEELQRQTVTIEKLGHDYKNPVWVWDGFTAKYIYTCERDNNHKLELDADITSEITLAPTCLATGKKVYTATVEYQGNTYTDTKEEILPALGHNFDYNNPVWSWNEYSSATVEFTCLNDTNHKDTYNATITSEVTEAPTCITTGVRTYTATVQANGKTYTNTKTEVIEALGHTEASAVVENRVEPTCEVAGHYDLVVYCTVCGEELSRQTIEIPALGHTEGEAVVENRVEATCEANGHYDLVVYCSVCGEELSRETIEIPALGHEYGELISEVPATCTTSGIKAHYHCERCNKYFDSNKNEVIYEELIIEALGHTNAEALEENRVEPTCETPGSYDLVVYCSVCGEELSRETIEIPALGHNFDYNNPVWTWVEYSSATVEFTCLNDTNHKDTYNATITSEVTEAPTCITTGVRTYTATVQANGKTYTDTKTEVLPALGHTEAEAVVENRVEPTCTEAGHYDLVVYCTVCGLELSRQTIEIPALGHTEREAVVENRVEATYESNGHYDLVVYCSVCSEELSRETIEIPALGHEYGELIPEVPATCTTTGIKAHYHCLECGKYFDQDKNEVTYEELIIEALGHVEATAVEENRVEPTCTEAGHYDLVVYCSVCGEELSRETIEIPALGHNFDYNNPVWTWNEYSSATVEFTCLNDLDHKDTYNATITFEVTEAPTCITTGVRTYTATVQVNGKTYTDTKTEVIEALGHTEAETVVENRVEPTCIEAGHYDLVVYCTVCGEELSRQTIEIPALGHTEREAVVENRVEPTCTKVGHYDSVVYCQVCGEEISRVTIEIPALGHEYGELMPEVPATCTTSGVKTHYHCDRCNKYFDINKNEVTYESLIIEALGHTAAKAVVENKVEATCETEGHYDLVVYCSRCGEELSRETIIIPALGHEYGELVAEVPATCTKTGIKAHYHCLECGKYFDSNKNEVTYEELIIEALGHTEANAVEENRVETTCTEAGRYDLVVYCQVCGEELSRETIIIPALGHTAAETVVENRVEPTCTKTGHYDSVVYCQVCGEEISRVTIEIPALGHTEEIPVEENRVEATCEMAGHYDLVVYCSVCGEEISRETIEIPALGHNFDYNNPVWTWNEYSFATVTFTCLNDVDHKDTYNATITSEVTEAPTCITTGVRTYTATVSVDGKTYTNTKTEILTALGHAEAPAVVENNVEPTCETAGHYDLVVYCTVCGEELSRQTIEIPALGHTEGEAVVENRVEATCESNGHYDLVVYCSVCGEELSRETIEIPALGHAEAPAVVENKVDPTCTEAGHYDLVVYCQVCGLELSRETITVEALGHDYDYSNPVWSWNEYSSATVTFTCLNDADHKTTYNAVIESEITVNPTCTIAGTKIYTAAVIVNGNTYTSTKEETLNVLGHTEAETVVENRIEPTCETPGSYDLVVYCTVCGEELSRETIIIPALGHEYGELIPEVLATCTTTGIKAHYHCERCNKYFDSNKNEVTYEELIIEALGHKNSEAVVENMVEATCEVAGHYDLVVYCSVCGEELSRETIEIPALGHDYDLNNPVWSWNEYSSATVTFTCLNDENHEDIHTAEITSEVTQAPTCEETGIRRYTAIVTLDGKTYTDTKDLVLPALGHTNAEAVVENKVDATCDVDGSYDLVVYCQVCGKELSRNTYIIPAFGHDYDYSDPEWTWDGYSSATVVFTCSHDEDHKISYNAIISIDSEVLPTCTQDGVRKLIATITVNGSTYTNTKTEVLPALGHTEAEAVVENMVEPTCETSGSYDLVVYCSVCGEELSRETIEIEALGHNYDTHLWVWNGYDEATITFYCAHDNNHQVSYNATITSEITLAPTDSTAGEKTYTATVVVDGITYTNTKIEVLTKLHHAIITVHAKEATCDEDGNITYYYCPDCNIYYSDANLSVEINYEDTIIPALGHIYSDYIDEVLPTCTTNGMKAHYHCQRCNKYFDKDKNEVSYESLVIEALGHTLLPAVKENEVLPTCEEDGHYDLVVYCSVCGEVVSRETIIIPALGHNYSDGVWYWNEYSSATLTYTCLNDSNHKLVYDATITSVVTIEPTDNTAGEKVYTATVVVDGITYTSQKVEELPKLHHAIITVYEKAATCTEDGNITYYYCPDCHIYYSDANLSNEITLEETIIHALGHNPSEAVVENRIEPTCETEGHYDLVVYCSRCGLELLRETIIIPALGHEYGELVAEVPATCTTTGIKTHYHCLECGKYFDQDKNEVTYEELIIEALGHTEATAVEENRVEPTCTETGHYDLVVYCSVCGEELSRETITISALGHTESLAVVENRVEATCETAGHYDLVVYCSVCGEIISKETITIPAIGHGFDYDNPVWTWQGYESAQITFTCKHDSTHKSIHNATITSETTVEPTDNTSGLKVYTAVVEVLGITYKNQKQEELPKLHHAIITVYEKAATCEEDGNITYYYCPDCNIYYSDATLSNEITYEATIIPALGHNPSEAVVENKVEATCETTGSYDLVVYCSRCGKELSRETIIIPALGHEYGELIAEVSATCTTTGIKAHYHCLECGKYFDQDKNEVTYEELIIEALGHTEATAVIENRVEATCTQAGHYDLVVYCQVCGEEISRETITIPALGHTEETPVEENRVEATCETVGHYDLVVYCQVCGEELSRETITIPALGHDFDYSNPVWTWKDYESAQITFTCLNDLNHKDTYNATITSEITLAPTDTTTGTKEYMATVIVNGLTYTDTKVEELPVTAHTIEVVYAKSPTCEEDGNITYYYCPDCNKYYSDTNLLNEITLEETIIHALGHNPSEAVVENRIEATCETEGRYDLVVYCSRCGEELSRETIVIPALGHEYGELIPEVSATCTTTGIKAHYHCLECGKYFDQDKNEVTYEELIIEALGHTEANAVIENRVEATCEVAGHYDLVVYCSVCGEELSREIIEIPALGHTPLEAVVENRVEPTCEVAGSYDLVVYCSVCGEIISKETIEIEALGHEYDLENPVWTWISYQSVTITFTCLHDANHKDVHNTNISSEITIAPTDNASGMKKYTASITIYGHEYKDVRYEELPKNHHAITTVHAKDATCEENGNILYYYCAECDKYYSDANLSNEITLEETIILALGHNPSEAVVENKVEATCETPGSYDLVVYCSVCGEELSRETIIIPALGHEYGELIPEVPATCTTTGIKAHYHCLECGKYFDSNKNEVTYEELIIEALGHKNAEAVVENMVEATCTEAGHYDLVVYCQVCGEELSRETITIPALGHTEGTPVEENRVEATCETVGHYDLVVYCSVCGEELSREPVEIEALGHDYDYSNPVWTWISYQAAKVTFTCKHNLEHTITYDAEITSLVTVLPTDSQSGLKVYTATVIIGSETFTSKKIEELPKNHHNITVVYAKDATCDEDGNILYYYCAECDKYYLDGALKNEITLADTIIPKLGHTYGELIALVEPTCSNDGMKEHYHCQVCGKYFDSNKNEVTYESLIIEALGHMPLEAVVENKIEATCETSGSYDLVIYCERCHHELSRETITIEALGHDYQNPVWHWNGFDFATLTFTCINDANHKDVYNASISSEITVMPTDSQSGLRVYTALVYAYGNTYTDTKEEALPKNHHTIVTIDGVPATCDTDGHITYYYCPDCNLYYSDAALSNIITLDDITIKAYGHKPSDAIVENNVEATCTTSGSYDLVIYCERCHHELSRETVIVDALGHDYIFVDEVLPTCLETGVRAHYICNRCNKYFDINKNEVTYESLITNALGHEEASKVVENVIEATCTTSGSYDLVTYCSHCHIELSRERFVTNPLEHDYDYHHESWEWLSVSDAIISFSCLHDASHKISYHANITSNVILAPTCLEDGILRYTATITINGVNYESIKDVAIAKTGHNYDYSNPVWNWISYEEAKVSFTCLNDNHHQDIYDSIISSMITLEPTCEAIGYKEYTATVIVNGHTYTNKVIEELAALGHDYQFVDKLLPLCEETGLDSHYHCDRCDKYFDSNKNEVTYESLVIEALGHSDSDKVIENNILPTCLEFGSYDLVTYCSHCGIELNRETINVNPLGHDYSLVDTLEPTGDTKGFMEHYYCNRCHKYFDLDKNEVSYDSLVIPELGYTYTYIVRDKVFESYHGYKGDTLIIPKYPQTYEENEILYRFIGFDKEIPNELTEDITFVALYRMERIYLKEVVIDLPNELMIDSSYHVEVRKLEDSEEFKGYLSRYFSDYDLTQAYKIVVTKGEEEIDLSNYNLTIKMKKKYLTELEDDSKLFVLNSNNEIEELDYTIDGQYIVFNTSAMSNFAFANSNSNVLYLVLIVQSLSLGMLVLILVIKKFVKR